MDNVHQLLQRKTRKLQKARHRTVILKMFLKTVQRMFPNLLHVIKPVQVQCLRDTEGRLNVEGAKVTSSFVRVYHVTCVIICSMLVAGNLVPVAPVAQPSVLKVPIQQCQL